MHLPLYLLPLVRGDQFTRHRALQTVQRGGQEALLHEPELEPVLPLVDR